MCTFCPKSSFSLKIPTSIQFPVHSWRGCCSRATTLINILQCDKNLLQGSPHPREFLILLSGVSRPGSVHLRGQQRDEGWRVINCPWTQTGCLHLCRSCATHPQNSGNWCSTPLKTPPKHIIIDILNNTFTVAASENCSLSCQFKGFMWFSRSNASFFEIHK